MIYDIIQIKLITVVVIRTSCSLFIEMTNKSFLYFKNLEQLVTTRSVCKVFPKTI